MRRFVSALALMALVAPWSLMSEAFADSIPINKVRVLPLSDDQVLIQVKAAGPLPYAIKQTPSGAVLVLTGGALQPQLIDATHCLDKGAFAQPTSYAVLIKESGGRTELKFQSSKVKKITIVAKDSDFQRIAAMSKPAYPVTKEAPELASQVEKVTTGTGVDPATLSNQSGALTLSKVPPIAMAMNAASTVPAPLTPIQTIQQAFGAFQQQDYGKSTDLIRGLYNATVSPSEILVKLLSALYVVQGDKLNALMVYGHGVSVYPKTMSLGYCKLLIETNQQSKALTVLSQFLQRTDLDSLQRSKGYYMLGSLLVEQQQYAKAKEVLQHANMGAPNNPYILFNLAIAAEGVQQPKEALVYYTQALQNSDGELRQDVQTQISRLSGQPSEGVIPFSS